MREIKFRGWHKEDKVMVYKLNSLALWNGVLRPDDYILMQYTGLKDKNGKEIYEGDILKLSFDGVDCTDELPFIMNWEENTSMPFSLQYYESSEDYEVIGNIHENYELLEAK